MRLLYLLRHARPVVSNGTMSDFERPLSQAGRIEAQRIAGILASEQLHEATIVSSPALRARETAELVQASNGWPVTFESRIYDAELSTLHDVIRQRDDADQIVILVGHNPGMESLLRYFSGEVQAMPTAGLAKVILDCDSWRDSTNVNARLEWLLTPNT